MQTSNESLIFVHPEQSPTWGLLRVPLPSLLGAFVLHVGLFAGAMTFHHLYGAPVLGPQAEEETPMFVEFVVEAVPPEPVVEEEPKMIEEEIIEEVEEEIPEEIEEVEEIEEPEPLPPEPEEEEVVLKEEPKKPKPRIREINPVKKPTPKLKPKPKQIRPVQAAEKAPVPVVAIAKPKKKLGFIKPVFPAYLRNPAPPYPRSAKRRKQEGVVLLFVQVDEKGRALSVRIEKSSGHMKLDSSALETVKKWRFLPARKNNIPVPSDVIVPIRFQLKQA